MPLYRDNSLRTIFNLPFRVVNSTVQKIPLPIRSVKVDPNYANNAECKVIIDPFINSNFILRCLKSDDVKLIVEVNMGNRYNKVSYGPINIIEQSDVVIVEPPPPAVDPDIAAGKTLVEGKCLTCHTHANVYDLKSRNLNNLESALSGSVPPMSNLNLNAQQIMQIKKYINSVGY